MTPIQEWYANKSVFVTGGTGFIGKILLEKMLRALPQLSTLYVLVRPKRGLTPQQRIKTITELPIFDKLREESPECLKKLVPLEGDLSLEYLGLSKDDRRTIIEEVSIVIHMAATLRLEAALKDAIIQNTLGTKRVMELCKKMKQLEAVVHCSTAFCHCDQEILEEKIYPPLKDPYTVINIVQTMLDDKLAAIEKEILQPHPNSYTFSKRLAETVAWDMGKYLPLAIGRPSIVIPVLCEPLPGWVDSLNGPVGLLVGAGKGVIRTMLVDEKNHAEVIPADIVANALIAMAWYRGTRTFDETPVFNMTQAKDMLDITWGEVLEKSRKLFFDNPFEMMLWCPGGNIRTNRFVHNLLVFFLHMVPAYLIDFLMLIFLQNRFMVRIQRKINIGLHLLQYFTLREWHFCNEKAQKVQSDFAKDDLELFYMFNVDFNVDNYLVTALLGTRQYCLKEDLKTLPRSRRYIKFLYYLDKITKILLCVLLVWGLFRIFNFLAQLLLPEKTENFH